MNFVATKAKVLNRGSAPDSYLAESIAWCKGAPDDTFAVNNNQGDVFNTIHDDLGPWIGDPGSPLRLLHRKAVMLEIMRAHAGFESSWDWEEGVDTTNQTSMEHLSAQETGIFQVSFDSTELVGKYMLPFAREHDIDEPSRFIPAMKANHSLAMEYYARLVRVNISWAGPLVRRKIQPWLRKDSVKEFMAMINTTGAGE